MKKEPNLNPKRDYVTENIFSIIGAFIIWIFKGFKSDFNKEIVKDKMFRNVIVLLIFWLIILSTLAYVYVL